MYDEIEGRIWIAHHAQFSRMIGDALAMLRDGARRLAGWDGSGHQLFAIVAAFAVTLLTFKGTAA
jgi:hypothetical protein